nr:MAG: capsid protein [Cressdnaviricota sp.]
MGYWDESRMRRRVERRQNFGKVLKSSAGFLGSLISGRGDYNIVSNSIISGSSGDVPQFENTGYMRSTRIQHREYIMDVSSSTAFVNASFGINPTNAGLFPWLSTIASAFQEYKIHGLVFTYNSMSSDALNSTNTALGSVIMSTDYNAGSTPFANKQQAENSEYTVSCKPSESLQHGVECDPAQLVNQGHLYISALGNGLAPTGEDIKTYNMGIFQFMTTGSQAAAVIGELWVSYDIELIKPVNNTKQVGGAHYFSNTGVTTTQPCGTVRTAYFDNIGLTWNLASTQLTFPPTVQSGDLFMFHFWWQGTSGSTVAPPTFAGTLCNVNYAKFQGSTSTKLANTGTNVDSESCIIIVLIGAVSDGNQASFSITTSALPGSPNWELMVNKLSSNWA